MPARSIAPGTLDLPAARRLRMKAGLSLCGAARSSAGCWLSVRHTVWQAPGPIASVS